MKTTVTYQESYRPKQGFGARLLFCAFLLSLIGLSKAFAQVPPAPTAFGASNITCSSFNANWDTVSSATAYYLDVSTSSTFTTFVSSFNNLNVGNVTTYNVTGLTAGTHYYRLRAEDGNGTSLNSNTIAVNVACNNVGTITSPSNGATINNRCDLQFCVSDSSGFSGYYMIYSDLDPYGAVAISDYQNGLSGVPFCLGYNDMYNAFAPITAGNHTFYLYRSDGFTTELVDSVALTLTNTISTLKSELTFSYTPSTNGNYDFSVSGLSTAYNCTLYLQEGGNFIDSLHISNSTSATLTHHFPYNASFNNLYLTLTSPCNGGGAFDTLPVINITSSSCNSYTQANINNQLFSMGTNCVWDTIHTDMDFYYENLSAGTATITVNWGDGTIDTYPYAHGAGNGTLNLSGWLHNYATPGVYTILCTISDPSACYNDSLIQTINASSACGNLSGTVYNDANSNCTQDMGEVGLANILVTATQGINTYYAWTDYLGNYSFPYLSTGSYTVQVGGFNQGYTISCSNSLPHSVNLNSGNVVANFAVNCSGAFDVGVTHISLMSGFYPGIADNILPHVGMFNSGCTAGSVSGQVKIVLDACIQYTGPYSWSNAGAPDAVIPASTGDTLVWNVADINNIGSFSYWDYAVNITTCTSAQVGDTACITIMVLPTNGDADPTNNIVTQCFQIGVSYDPNNKEVMPAGAGDEGFIPADEPSLTYTINFQNTGTAKAWNIYVMDTIDTDLDINSIEILSASHKMQVYTLPNRAIKFMFADIMLEDSTHNEPLSHGYVTFKIKLNPGLAPGTEIENTGHIYFDYNEPVVTNTTLNTIEIPSSVLSISKSAVVKVYPNPAKESVTVLSNSSSAGVVTVTDMLGKTVKEVKTNSEKTVVNTADLQSGVYFIKLAQDNVIRTEKIMITK